MTGDEIVNGFSTGLRQLHVNEASLVRPSGYQRVFTARAQSRETERGRSPSRHACSYRTIYRRSAKTLQRTSPIFPSTHRLKHKVPYLTLPVLSKSGWRGQYGGTEELLQVHSRERTLATRWSGNRPPKKFSVASLILIIAHHKQPHPWLLQEVASCKPLTCTQNDWTLLYKISTFSVVHKRLDYLVLFA